MTLDPNELAAKVEQLPNYLKITSNLITNHTKSGHKKQLNLVTQSQGSDAFAPSRALDDGGETPRWTEGRRRRQPQRYITGLKFDHFNGR